jgi:hypothetical protein
MSENSRLVIPAFGSEKEEAEWLDSHQDLIARRFSEAAARGALGSGRVAARAQGRKVLGASPTLTIRIPKDDLDRARALAEGKGLRYQTYLRMLIHEGLDRDARNAN